MVVRIYGIRNCDTMKKTFKFLEEKGVKYDFIDYKKTKPDSSLLVRFADKVGYGELINKKGTTYKKLGENDKSALNEESAALAILSENSSMIKRPLVEFPDGTILLGFDEEKLNQKLP
jgi:arsenate reductase (glutaredoxin)